MESLISIIIPCYNDWQYVEQAVNSALYQTYGNKEIIVVDDGSNAKTKEVLKQLESKITKLITQENQGQSTARNIGIQAANGDYILVLDSDDFFEPTFCEKAMLVFQDSSIKLVTSFTKRFNNFFSDEYYPGGGDLKKFLICNEATGSAIYRKKDCIAIGGYDEKMRSGFEDWEFYIRLLQNGGKAFVIPEFLFNYRLKENSTTSKANKLKYNLRNFIYNKHKNLYILYFEDFISYLLSNIEKEEKEKIKNINRLEFRIGKSILKPFRYIKFIFKKILFK
ncbi:glycosyltransferase [Flavobacterium sp. JLP]|uniref:glycosyltransferase family 2 protein n=1 Tax=Flavobacterium sp. JLP TaxID=2783793 RepID=UPI00188D7EF2|nr:glycosyltransferase [Flavobacterium sp. JLP]MBF4507138.1 glycosyltransferase [Flavobacterium sp. JLP]